MEKLISMTDFVFEQRNKQNITNIRRFWNCEKYAKFLKQPLELWMFVPCDEDGNVLEKPREFKNKFSTFEKYQQAKERCLFDRFEFTESQKFSTVNKIENSVHWYTKNRLYITTKKEDGYHSYFQLFTVEDLIQCEIQLTKTSQKQIGL